MRIVFFSLILLTSSAYAMDQEKSPGQQFDAINQQIPTTIPADITQRTQLSRVSITTLLSTATTAESPEVQMELISQQEENDQPYLINSPAIKFSIMLKSLTEVSQATGIIRLSFDYPDMHVRFVAELLNFFAYYKQHNQQKPTDQDIIQCIRDRTGNFNIISFADTLTLLNYFDIPLAFTTITKAYTPPQPTTQSEKVIYNQQLVAVFNLAKQSTTGEIAIRVGSEQLWQLFGRMLYPGCLQFKDIEEMINFITAKLPGGKIIRIVRAIGKKICFLRGSGPQAGPGAQHTIEQIVLGKYIMQQHPELYSHRLQKITRSAGNVYSVAFSPDGQTLTSGSWDNTIRLWRVADGSLIRTLTGHTNHVYSVAFSPDGQTLASGSVDSTIRLWRVADGSAIRTVTGHTGHVFSVAFSPDGQTLASGSWNGTIQLLQVADGSLIRTLTGHTGTVASVAFSPDGQTIASGSGDNNTIRLWRVADGSPLRTLTGHTDFVTCVAFSPDGQTLASGSWDGTIQLWRVADGSPLRTLTGHTYDVACVAFSPDGQTLASGSWDGTIQLWRVADGKLIQTITRGASRVNSVAFSPDGQTLASASYDNTIQLWGYRSLRAALMAIIAKKN